MKSLPLESYVTETQDTAVAIESLSQILYRTIDDHFSYADMPYENGKEQLLGMIDSIRLLAKQLNMDGALV